MLSLLPQWMKTGIKWGFGRAYQLYAAAVPPSVSVLTFHEIHPAGPYTPRMFETLLAALAKRAEFLTLAEACARLRAGRPLSRHVVVLTFDDGLQSQFVYAYPLLQRYQAKATFFVVPGLMTERRWLWNREAQIRLEEISAANLPELPELAGCRGSQPGSALRQKQASEVVQQLKLLAEAPRQHILSALQTAYPHSLPHHLLNAHYAPVTWDELQRLDRKLVEIGSHSWSHTILRDLPEGRLDQEIRDSRLALEQHLGYQVVSFCYPNGDYDAATVRRVQGCYQQAVTVVEGAVPRPPDFHQLPRIWVSSDHEDTLFRLARHQLTVRRASQPTASSLEVRPRWL